MTTFTRWAGFEGEWPRHERRGRAAAFVPWFRADWRDVLFVHYAIDPGILRPRTPFALDLFEGRAWVSLVAFTQTGLRPAVGGKMSAALMWPVAAHTFLNLRTYVRVDGRPAIQFLAEWIPNRLAMLVGPRLYGLPFRLGWLDYRNDRRDVTADGDAFRLTASAGTGVHTAEDESLDEFLLERYAAVTWRQRRGRKFDIEHAPWVWRRAAIGVEDDTLVRRAAPWFSAARPVCAHVSAGVTDVGIGGPEGVVVHAEHGQTSLPMAPKSGGGGASFFGR
jgi:uncharacterized protein YqjF (DUF2071 family)